MTEKKSFAEAIKAAAALKTKVPQATAAKVQEAKFKNQVQSNKPSKRSVGRGG
jgi:hypothetical protein